MTPLRSSALLVAAVAVAGVAAGLASAGSAGPPSSIGQPRVTGSPSPSVVVLSAAPLPHVTPPPGAGSGAHPHPELDDDYVSCAKELGFDPGTVDVMLDRAEKPMGVFSTYELPADVHGPCMARLGGEDLGQSSYGHPPVTVRSSG